MAVPDAVEQQEQRSGAAAAERSGGGETMWAIMKRAGNVAVGEGSTRAEGRWSSGADAGCSGGKQQGSSSSSAAAAAAATAAAVMCGGGCVAVLLEHGALDAFRGWG